MAESAPEIALLWKRRFAPLFVTNLLGVVNDNMFKAALLVLASYGVYRAAPDKAAMLATVATGVFIAPFFLLSALAICGGVFVIPLYAVLQADIPPDARSRILAANNIVNAGVSVAVIVLAAVLLRFGLGVPNLIGLLGLGTGGVALTAALLDPSRGHRRAG